MLKTKQVKDGFILGLIYLFLLYGTIFIPAIEIITIFILPLPFVIFAKRYGLGSAVVFDIVLLFIAFCFATFVSVPLTILALLGGTLLGLSINEKLSPYETWARGTLGFVIGLLIIFVFIQVALNINLIEQFSNAIKESVASSQELLKSFGLELTGDELTLIEEQMMHMIQLIPVFLVGTAIVISFIVQWFSYKILNKADKDQLYFPPFRNFQLPKVVIWIYLIAILLTWGQYEPGSTFYQAVINVTNLTSLLVTLQGFSFLFYYVYIKKLSKAIPIIAIIVSLLFPFIGLYLIRFLGIIDLGISLRERISKEK